MSLFGHAPADEGVLGASLLAADWQSLDPQRPLPWQVPYFTFGRRLKPGVGPEI